MFSIVIIIVYDYDGVLTIHGLVMNDFYGIMIVTTIIVVFLCIRYYDDWFIIMSSNLIIMLACV